MTTQEKAHIAPILQTVANIPALNLKALKLDLYYIPRTKTTSDKLVEAIADIQHLYNFGRSDARDFDLQSIEANSLIELYVDYSIMVIDLASDDKPERIPYNSYILDSLTINNRAYQIIIGL